MGLLTAPMKHRFLKVLEFMSRYAAQKKVVRQLNFFRSLDSEKRKAASKDLEQMRVHAGNDI